MAHATNRSSSLNRISLLLLALTLQGCASLSQDECVTADWHAIGYEDGLHGKPADRIGAHRKACAEHGVTADLARYNEGRLAGLAIFCEPRNGYRLGRAGNRYAGVCPAPSEADFLVAYGEGREIHDLQQSVTELHRQVEAKRKALQALDEAIIAKGEELVQVGVTPRRRAALLADLYSLQGDAAKAEDELHELTAAHDRRRAELDQALAEAPRW